MKTLESTLATFILLTMLVISNIAHAELQVGQAFPVTSLTDQFDEKHTVTNSQKLVIMSFEREVSEQVSTFLSQQPSAFLATKHCLYISDISAMPSLIAKLFALPKMRDYNHKIMLNKADDFPRKYNAKLGKLTVYQLNQGIITAITFIDANKLATVFN